MRVATAVAVEPPLKKAQVEGSLEPTREQMGRVEFTHAPVRNELGRTIGFAYRRNPLFETMAKTMSIAPPELEALRVYRRYRLWGSYDDVADVRFHIQQGNPDTRYANAADARAALDVANQMSRTKLRRLADEELKD